MDNSLKSDAAVSKDLNQTEHNAIAQLFRNGLAVSAFALLEAFIRGRTGEILARISSGAHALPFNRLPDKLQDAAVYGAMEALVYRRKIDSDKVSFRGIMQDHAELIASTKRAPYQLSEYAFGYEKPNMNDESISALCKAFNVAEPWITIAAIASRCGLGQPKLKDDFANGMQRRHLAAHSADAQIEHTDLKDFTLTIRAVAIGFDLAMSAALGKMLTNDSAYLNKGEKITDKSSNLSFVVRRKADWAHVPEGTTRARRRYVAEADAIAGSTITCKSKVEALVVMGSNGMPTVWFTPFVD